jgi:putative Mg2+ transporter-C (MgtC) family protein
MKSDLLKTIDETYLLTYFGSRVLVATFCGLVIGWERELKSKIAGIRTNVLVCVGACLMTSMSFLVADYYTDLDPMRVVGQIVTGVGFLGAGVIFKSNDNKVTGVTTAAFIWVMCALGILSGCGFVLLPIILTVGLLVISFIFKHLEDRIDKYKKEN